MSFLFCSVGLLQQSFSFFFNHPPTTEIYTTHNTLSLHDALPIYGQRPRRARHGHAHHHHHRPARGASSRSEEHTSELQSLCVISYAVLCLKKKNDDGGFDWQGEPSRHKPQVGDAVQECR